ncbi:MAG: C10 family peptidase [Bacteroidales bacterium]|nr:C10 family peptidase [Bacteroidales bacterium]
MKKIFFIALSLFLCSCHLKEDILPDDFSLFENEGIPEAVINISEDDAKAVALLYNNGQLTRSSAAVESVVPVMNDIGTPLLYIVNLEDGCTIVSATKKYPPILANIENGNLEWPTNSGADLFIRQYLDELSILVDDADAPVLKKEWSIYEQHNTCLPPITKVNDDYNVLLEAFLDDMYGTGYEFRHLTTPFEDMPEDVYRKFCGYAEDTDYIGYSYWDCAIIGRREYSVSHKVSPMITAEWKQGKPYNAVDGKPLGCTTVALGQTMRYFKFPQSFKWGEMPDSSPMYEPVLCDFLYDLKTTIGVGDDGGASVNQVEKALKKYGYSYSLQNHNTGTLSASLFDFRPVLCFGKNLVSGEGHAWICDGIFYYETYTEFVLYTLSFMDGHPVRFEKNEPYLMNYVSSTLFHMNWGFGGVNNGNYFDSNLEFTNPETGDKFNYSSNGRQELLLNVK